MLDAIASVMAVPVALLMSIDHEDIEVFLSSKTESNPYSVGDREHLQGSGLYCERVINTRQALFVPNALADPEWANNPDIKLNMISYLGYPIRHGDGRPFGTICVLDREEIRHTRAHEVVMESMRGLIESHLALLELNTMLGEENKQLADYLDELQQLRGLVSICSCCKDIQDRDGAWQPVEKWLIAHPRAEFSHGLCPQCYRAALASLDS
jgi:GAF domain-containing protein